ncbi:hypothetical protein ACKKBF_B02900 [Auxenochlorella protothecoides x Auxenochlorella symbiontica]
MRRSTGEVEGFKCQYSKRAVVAKVYSSEDGAAQTNKLVRRDARLTQRVAYCKGFVLLKVLLFAGCNVGVCWRQREC